MKQSHYEELAYLSSYRVSMRSVPMLSLHPTNLHALARLLPFAGCHVFLQQQQHLVMRLFFRVLQGSLAALCNIIVNINIVILYNVLRASGQSCSPLCLHVYIYTYMVLHLSLNVWIAAGI